MSLIKWPTGFSAEDFVGSGDYAFVFLDASSRTVVKFPHDHECEAAIRNEKAIYERFEENGSHPGLLRYFGPHESGLRLEFARNYGLRKYIRDRGRRIGVEQRLRWCQQIAEALAFIHSNEVIHGDLQWANVFLDGNLNAKVADFAGSSLHGSHLLAAVTASHRYPGSLLSKRADIFSLGSTLWEIICGRTPYDGRPSHEIKVLFEMSKYPETKDLGLIGEVILGCWRGEFPSADEVAERIKAIRSVDNPPPSTPFHPNIIIPAIVLVLFWIGRSVRPPPSTLFHPNTIIPTMAMSASGLLMLFWLGRSVRRWSLGR